MPNPQIDEKQPGPTDIARPSSSSYDNPTFELDDELYARHVEIKNFEDLMEQRGTPIPALFNTFYKFIQNPSAVSVETFKRMVDTDDTIGSGVDFLTTCLAARLGDYTHPNKEITQHVNKTLAQIKGGWFNCTKEMLSATWVGNSVSEKVWGLDQELGYVRKKIVTLPPTTILFETERTGELTYDGILQYQRNYNPMLLSNGVNFLGGVGGFGFSDGVRPDMFAKLGDLPFPLRSANTFNYLSVRIPRQKCIHYAFDAQGKFGNPYGRSLLRRAYKYYVIKDEVLRMMAIALDRKGTPLTVIFADPHTTIQDATQVTGGNQKGKVVGQRADLAAAEAFRRIHNDSVIVLPGKKDQIFGIETISQQSNAGDFLEALKFCNSSILRALLIPALIFSSGDGTGSYALGEEHAKTWEKILDGWLEGFKAVLLEELIFEIIAYNFPESVWRKDGLGTFGKRELTSDERQKEAAILQTGVDMGAISMQDLEDFNKTREKLGYEPREAVFPEQDLLGEEEEEPEGDKGE